MIGSTRTSENAKVATLTMEWWKVLKAVRDNRRFPDHSS